MVPHRSLSAMIPKKAQTTIQVKSRNLLSKRLPQRFSRRALAQVKTGPHWLIMTRFTLKPSQSIFLQSANRSRQDLLILTLEKIGRQAQVTRRDGVRKLGRPRRMWTTYSKVSFLVSMLAASSVCGKHLTSFHALLPERHLSLHFYQV